MIKAEQVQNRRVQIVNAGGLVDGLEAEIISGPVNRARWRLLLDCFAIRLPVADESTCHLHRFGKFPYDSAAVELISRTGPPLR